MIANSEITAESLAREEFGGLMDVSFDVLHQFFNE